MMATPVPKTMALPMPCIARNRISMEPETESAHVREVSTMITFPVKKTRFLPQISASFPKGTRNTAEESRKDMETQLMATAPRENSLLIAGRAMFMAAPRKGLIKEVIRMEIRINPLGVRPDTCFVETNVYLG